MQALLTEFANLFTAGWWQQNWIALVNIITIDVVLAGDNAIVVGLAASRVSARIAREGHLLGDHRRGCSADPFRRRDKSIAADRRIRRSPAACCCCGSAGRCTGRSPRGDARSGRDRGQGCLGCSGQGAAVIRPGHIPDRRRRRLDVARQRAGGGRRGGQEHGGAGDRTCRCHRADGNRLPLHCQSASAASLGSPGSAC